MWAEEEALTSVTERTSSRLMPDGKSTAECRPVAGPCDVAESCDGVDNDCPRGYLRAGHPGLPAGGGRVRPGGELHRHERGLPGGCEEHGGVPRGGRPLRRGRELRRGERRLPGRRARACRVRLPSGARRLRRGRAVRRG